MTLEGIAYRYHRGASILSRVSFELKPGEILGVIGPNGSGKSTLLKIMAGILSPTAGQIVDNGMNLSTLSARARARRVAYLPQEFDFPLPFRVLEIVLMGRAPYQSSFGWDSPEDIAIARQALARVGGEDLEERNIQELSGGEKQRVVIARLLAQQTPLMILDEPTSQLDLGYGRRLADLLTDEARGNGRTVVWASHDLSLVTWVADRLLVLHSGRMYRLGPPEMIMNDSLIQTVYGDGFEVIRHHTHGRPYVLPR